MQFTFIDRGENKCFRSYVELVLFNGVGQGQLVN